MTYPKKVLGIIALSALLAVNALAAPAQTESAPPAGRGPAAMNRGKSAQFGPEYRLERMTQQLHLTAEQQAAIKPILAEEQTELQGLRGNDSYNRDERRSRLQELNSTTYGKIKPILTPEQQKTHESAKLKITENRSKKRTTRPGPNPGENTPEMRLQRLTLDLGLTAGQQNRIKPILADESSRLEALRGNDTYNREQRRAELLKLNQGTSEKIRSILTPEQQNSYASIQQKIVERRSQNKTQNPAKP